MKLACRRVHIARVKIAAAVLGKVFKVDLVLLQLEGVAIDAMETFAVKQGSQRVWREADAVPFASFGEVAHCPVDKERQRGELVYGLAAAQPFLLHLAEQAEQVEALHAESLGGNWQARFAVRFNRHQQRAFDERRDQARDFKLWLMDGGGDAADGAVGIDARDGAPGDEVKGEWAITWQAEGHFQPGAHAI